MANFVVFEWVASKDRMKVDGWVALLAESSAAFWVALTVGWTDETKGFPMVVLWVETTAALMANAMAASKDKLMG